MVYFNINQILLITIKLHFKLHYLKILNVIFLIKQK